MDVLIALLVASAVLLVALAAAPRPATSTQRQSFFDRFVARREQELLSARLHVNARRFALVCLVSPPGLFLGGLLIGSMVVAIGGGAAGFLAPRLYLNGLVRAQRRRTEAEAPRLLQIIVSTLAAGRTYLEALEEARRRATDRWLRDDLDHIITQFHLDVPLEQSISEVRRRAAGRNIGLIWDNLVVCISHRIPASKAKNVFAELASTVLFNVQVQQEVKARTSGQRVQIWLLAAIVPGLFFYLRLINPDFFSVLDETLFGRFLLFPAAVCLEVIGIYLSFRVSQVEV